MELVGFALNRGPNLRTFYQLCFLFTTASRTALGPTQPPIQWVPGGKAAGAWSWPLTSI